MECSICILEQSWDLCTINFFFFCCIGRNNFQTVGLWEDVKKCTERCGWERNLTVSRAVLLSCSSAVQQTCMVYTETVSPVPGLRNASYAKEFSHLPAGRTGKFVSGLQEAQRPGVRHWLHSSELVFHVQLYDMYNDS